MNTRLSDYPAVVFAAQEPPCLSVYQKTHRRHPDNQQDPIRFRNLVKKLDEALAGKYPKRMIESLLRPYYDLAEDHRFWNHTLDGIAVLGAPGMFKIYNLQEDVKDIAVVSDSFYTKPLVRIFQSHERYQVLSLTRNEIRLYEGTKNSLDEVPLAKGVPRTMVEALGDRITSPHQTVASYGGTKGPAMHHGHGAKKDEDEIDAERFFRIVDKSILERHSQRSRLPLVLAALPENQGVFRQVSQNPWLTENGIVMNPDALGNGALQEKAWSVVEPQIRERTAAMLDDYAEAHAANLASEDIEHIAAAAAAGKVSALFIDNDARIRGALDRQTGDITPDVSGEPAAGELLDDIGELVLQKGGSVRVVPSDVMPSRTGIAATFRF
ncbi:hypothetical protein CHL67_00730 [Prosthecochloris sp. GSB1]|uniref:baeRF3 domain-containing protein n=1 Tax=Prosthecochloris sp. GSB1 TaxID=281093 RepID=UPI000B8C84A2|nr:hypothetical protein [Prosthecochloris sp. GSB1]ASQ89638.1 hypothetical protein CHL67_00730 [Prosthecochloris sp. GSB1]